MNTIGSPERLVVVTGAASGIGRAVVEAQLALGARVIGVDIQALAPSPEQAKAIDNGQLLAVQLDVRDSAAVDAVFDGIVERGERLTGLVSCAGVDDGGPSHEFGDDAFRRVVEINLFGTFYLCRGALRTFVSQETSGAIVCISSPFATVSPPGGVAAYASSKGGVSALTRNLAVEYASRGIRVNSVTPGATETPLMWANADPATVPRMRQQIAGEVPLGRIADPSEPAAAVSWLLSDAASYVTGATITCDGGVLAAGVLTL
ncbi:SDR family NAD(P)-dependent oxidoreductase [Saccharopolyspora phatthalungensis]|uniref:NAD(P)-dependent dehydrogenase (Short-subunit alcohol dehydrogenase family) n=1 Tax=Saccharopolyspora phatthalungensis TaxID=664693 RepID=A0A840QAY6_9PSEU|nr:SDR family oxidoreductase [Saccharopolyspora phatthalungensis]MBB5156941.1 NAD(P)-dependent dehydrogenase (short-subunit alcohol dehydrogenase family) [Saccharopolyspora phatthalungensis]